MKKRTILSLIIGAPIVLAGVLALIPAYGQSNIQCPTRPPGDSTNACASTAFVTNALTGVVLSVFGRTGTVTAQFGDYTATLVTYTPPGTGSVARTIASVFGDTVRATDFGVVCDNTTNNATAYATAVAATLTLDAKILEFPYGKCVSNASLSTTSPICFVGKGQVQTVLRFTGGTTNGVSFTYPGEIPGGCIKDMTIEAGNGFITSGFFGAGSSGVALILQNFNTNFVVQNIGIYNFGYGIVVSASSGSGGAWGLYATNFDIRFIANEGIQINCHAAADSGGDRFFTNGVISNAGYTGGSVGVGIHICKSGGDHFSSIDQTSMGIGVYLATGQASDNILYTSFNRILADTNNLANWSLDSAAGGSILANQCNDCWAGYGTNAGVQISGSGVNDFVWSGGKIRENGTQGINLLGGSDIRFNGVSIAANSRLNANVYPGVAIAAGVSKFQIINSNIGNYASSTSNQADGIVIDAGAGDQFIITNNILLSPGSGKTGIVNGATGTNVCVRNNIGSTVTVTTGTGC